MPPRVEAMIESQMLKWARRTTGLSIEDAARKARIRPELLSAWELGNGRPTISQLRKLGAVYKRPIAVFYLPEPPTEFQALRDFRRLPDGPALFESPELRFDIRQIQGRREFAIELYEQLEGLPPRFDLSTTIAEDPDDVASQIRGFLGVTRNDQTNWAPGYESLNRWRSALEQASVLVFQMTGVEVNEVRGFSISSDHFPVVVVNIKDSVNGRIFTMLHELTHLALQQGGLCDLSEGRLGSDAEVEVFCNRVAGAALVPANELLSETVVASRPEEALWSDDDIQSLAETYSCSREVILRRLLTCGRTTEEFYQLKRRQFQTQRERVTHRSGFAPPHRIAVSKAGHFFIRLVLDNYYQGNITASDVAELLDSRLKHVPRIEAAVAIRTG